MNNKNILSILGCSCLVTAILLNPVEQSLLLPEATSVVIHVSEFAAAGGEGEHAAGH